MTGRNFLKVERSYIGGKCKFLHPTVEYFCRIIEQIGVRPAMELVPPPKSRKQLMKPQADEMGLAARSLPVGDQASKGEAKCGSGCPIESGCLQGAINGEGSWNV